MADDHKALRRRCNNLEHGIHTISGAQTNMSQDLRNFMQQMGPLLALAQHQPHVGPTGGVAPAPAAEPASSATPRPAAPTADAPPRAPSEGAAAAAVPQAADGAPSFALVRQATTVHSGPYSPC